MKTPNNLPTFWNLVIRFTVVFVLVVMAIEMIFELFKSGNLNAAVSSFDDFTWLYYIAIKLIIGLAYGLFMAYLTLKRLKKQKRG
ncbi:MAG TPA: hypothetical protein VFY09_01195 [Flavobacteriaceae bacterium]|nr:hypothetical protein [Flavobacteriaceae bacterium]HEX5742497.1 hypothetical protein [Flavobacteriaceae bacterium]